MKRRPRTNDGSHTVACRVPSPARRGRRAGPLPCMGIIAFAVACSSVAALAQNDAADAPGSPPDSAAQTGAAVDAVLETDHLGQLIDGPARQAIDRGLAYLAASINDNGSWGSKNPRANTATALLAFAADGHLPGSRSGSHGDVIDAGIAYLVNVGRQQDGFLGERGRGMYSHGLATLALAQLRGEITADERSAAIDRALRQAVEVIVAAQDKSGGWRYDPKPGHADLSVTVMQLAALRAARHNGIDVSDAVIDSGLAYVRACREKGGGYRYQPNQSGASYGRTAGAVALLLALDAGQASAITESLQWLTEHRQQLDRNRRYSFYDRYYGGQAMLRAGPDRLAAWYPPVRDDLVRRQSDDGSWSADRGERPYATAMAVIVLTIPQRYLPMFN